MQTLEKRHVTNANDPFVASCWPRCALTAKDTKTVLAYVITHQINILTRHIRLVHYLTRDNRGLCKCTNTTVCLSNHLSIQVQHVTLYCYDIS